MPVRHRPRVAVVLAAGLGKRMGSALPKVLHRAAGRPLAAWALAAARAAGCARILVVVGHGGERVRAEIAADADLGWVQQERQLGTGHALAQVESHLGGGSATLLVVPGDAPLVTPATLDALARLVEPAAGDRGDEPAWGALAVADLDRPGSLGRVLATPAAAGGGERLAGIVEVADAGAEELAIRTVNAGFYALPAPEIFAYLHRLAPANAQGELYLTDAVVAAAAAGERVALLRLADPAEALGVNTPDELARAEGHLRARLEAKTPAGDRM